MLERLWLRLKRELRVALRTFFGAWLGLTLALQLWCLLESPEPRGAEDVALLLTFGFLICAFYMFWPACAVSACRVVYRILGWGAYAGALSSVLGVGVTLWLLRHSLGELLGQIFSGMSSMGPCGGHATGPAALLALLCLLAAIGSSPASLWALFKLLVALGGAVLVGSVPGVLLWLVLALRKAAELASRRIPR